MKQSYRSRLKQMQAFELYGKFTTLKDYDSYNVPKLFVKKPLTRIVRNCHKKSSSTNDYPTLVKPRSSSKPFNTIMQHPINTKNSDYLFKEAINRTKAVYSAATRLHTRGNSNYSKIAVHAPAIEEEKDKFSNQAQLVNSNRDAYSEGRTGAAIRKCEALQHRNVCAVFKNDVRKQMFVASIGKQRAKRHSGVSDTQNISSADSYHKRTVSDYSSGTNNLYRLKISSNPKEIAKFIKYLSPDNPRASQSFRSHNPNVVEKLIIGKKITKIEIPKVNNKYKDKDEDIRIFNV
eukprot:TRINITY_DN4705_c0_g1_i4.p1 TRINITY_DN4705_c0_g1~~TRINITY_DN4705_c0_g1_i4.p1  ORF type:complete len:291 (-),score=42.79 TRINITY_DN4705_c0_g1_i4:758-1630(-)